MSPWQRLCDHEWLLCAVLAFLQDGGDDIHSLWLLALDDGLTWLHARIQQHFSLSVPHARRLAMTRSSWSELLKLSNLPPKPRGQRLAQETVDKIEDELTRLGCSPHPNRRAALFKAVAYDHKSGTTRPEQCPHCRHRYSHTCRGGFHRCTAPGPKDTQHFCHASSHLSMYAAARDGRLESVVWLHYVVCYDQERALSLAARKGHVHVVAWLLDHAHSNNIKFDFRYQARRVESRGVPTRICGMRSQSMPTYIYEPSRPRSLESRPSPKRRVRFDPNCLATMEWLLDHGYRSGLLRA